MLGLRARRAFQAALTGVILLAAATPARSDNIALTIQSDNGPVFQGTVINNIATFNGVVTDKNNQALFSETMSFGISGLPGNPTQLD
jgi:hypothetical protein